MLASAGLDKTVRLWDVSNLQAVASIGQPLQVEAYSIVFSPDRKTLASIGDNATVRLWDVSNPQAATPIGQPLTGYTDSVTSVAFSPDGKTLASASFDSTVRLWDVINPQAVNSIVQLLGPDRVNSVAFSPDGQMVASVGFDKTIRSWAVAWTDRICRLVGRNLSIDEWTGALGRDVRYERTCPDLAPGEGAPADS
jgi:WD40 repeat protein